MRTCSCKRAIAWAPQKKNLCCPLPTDRKMRKNRVGFFFFFFFFFLCQIWAKNLLKFVFNGLKKHLHDLYMRFDCIPLEFSPFRNFKKNIGKLNSLTVRKKKKKKKKKSRPTDPIFKFWSGEGNITIFFFCLTYIAREILLGFFVASFSHTMSRSLLSDTFRFPGLLYVYV